MTNNKAVPVHLGLILDGNRRWAKAHGLPPLEGHRKGYENLKIIGRAGIKRGIKYISCFVFSTENWNRSQKEVNYLMKLLQWVLKDEVDELHQDNIKIKFAGSNVKLSTKILKAIQRAEHKTERNTAGTLILCLNYGGHQEIADAVNKIMANNPTKKQVTPVDIEQNLYAADAPPIDFIIRTSGERRLSNFMLWRAAYSELYFIDKHWPDFMPEDLDIALSEYAKRQRRFGL